MSGHEQSTTVGGLPDPPQGGSRVPTILTGLVWLLFAASLGALAWSVRAGDWSVGGLLHVDGLTVVLWVAVTFFSGVLHSFSRRYMAGNPDVERFFGGMTAFTLVVLVLVAADHFLLFALAWVGMGLAMADLIGHAEEWPQAQAAAGLARRYFLAGGAAVAVALLTLWWGTGATTVSGAVSAVGTAPQTVVLVAAAALVLAAMLQSALVPFHGWLLASMTAPTPASALMHAGFVNAGGVLLVRFAPVVTVDGGVMLAIVLVGAVSALAGKLMKTVRTDVKGTLGCSTVGQMGFMLMQAGFGFFAAAVTHLLLHGCYKAYQFLASGSRVEQTAPGTGKSTGSVGLVGGAVLAVTALAGGVVFAVLTGKGTALDGGLLLAGLVVLTVLQAARGVVARGSLPATLRYGAVPLVTLSAVAAYAAVYRAVEAALGDLPAVGVVAEVSPVHALVAAGFLAAYLAVETGVYRRSRRLYVALMNATQPPAETLLTAREEYDEH